MKGPPFLLGIYGIVLSVILAFAVDPPSVRSAGTSPSSFSDMPENDGHLSGPPQRVAVFPPILPAYLTIDEGASHIAGASEVAAETIQQGILSAIYPDASAIPSISKSVFLGDPERLLLLHPDAALSWPSDSDSLTRLGVPTVIALGADPLHPLEASRRLWTVLGAVTGKSARVAALLAQWDAQRRALARAMPLPGRPLKIVTLFEGPGIGWIGGQYSYLGEAIRFIGAENPAHYDEAWASGSFEDLLALNPDIILLTPDYDRSPAELFDDPAWRPLRAAQQRRIYQIPRLENINAPVDDPLFILWLAEVSYRDLMPRAWRAAFRQEYQDVYHVSPSDALIDWTVRMDGNRQSAGYDRFHSG